MLLLAGHEPAHRLLEEPEQPGRDAAVLHLRARGSAGVVGSGYGDCDAGYG